MPSRRWSRVPAPRRLAPASRLEPPTTSSASAISTEAPPSDAISAAANPAAPEPTTITSTSTRARLIPSSAFPDRLALLEERQRAFPCVLGRRHDRGQLVLDGIGVGEGRCGKAPQCTLLRRPDRERRVPADDPGPRDGPLDHAL